MKKASLFSLFIRIIMLISFVGCNVNTTPTSSQGTGGTEGPTPTQTWESGFEADTITPVGEFVQQPDVRDYTYAWWKNGFRATNGAQLNIQTGYYALSINPTRGKISTVGAIAKQYSRTEVLTQDEKFIDSLSLVRKMDYAVTLDGARKKFTGVTPIDYENDTTISNCVNGNIAHSRMIDNGRYMQTVDIMNLNFAGENDVTGRVEICATPRYFALEFSIWSKNGAYKKADLEYSVTLGDSYVEFLKSSDGKVITAREANGGGLTFVLPDISGASMTLDEQSKTVTVTLSGMKVTKREFKGVNVVVIPSVNAQLADADIYFNNARVTSEAVQIYPKEDRKQKTEFNTKGYLEISLNNMLTKFGPGEYTDENLDELDRLTFTIENPTDKAIKVPVQFYKTGKYGALGCSPMIRDARTGEPIGLQVQISKNWHEPVNYKAEDPKMWLSGYWFHGNTFIEVPASSSVTYEFCMTYATWGGAFASSHAQICLAGWGGNYQQWDTSSIGSFGEAFCYEPEVIHERGFIGDVRALLIYSIWGGGKYSLTENVGGGNFLLYYRQGSGSREKTVLAKTEYRKQGPNLTEVIYSGVTADHAIKYELTVQLPRTNDACRAYHSFKYTFLKDTQFSRLAFYQMGADYFNDNKYTSMAIGNDQGTVDITIDGVTYSGQFDTPVYDREQYVGSKNEMQRIEIPGEGLWAAMMGWEPCNYKVAPGSNRMLNLHYYNATINGKSYTKPALSIYHTYDGGRFPCIGVELSPPADCGNTIKAGSVVEGTVEWINLPVQKDEYYGPSKVMASIPAEDFNTWRAAYAYASGGKHTVTARVGTVIKGTPAKVECVQSQSSGDVVAEITVKGGMGYVPLTFSGVKHYSGYELQKKNGDAWEKVDQSTFGNDYWQAWYDDTLGTYELTFNVEHMGDGSACSYRLVKK
ncbi:MAG: hypothetical protein IKK58_05080 [Clostridia bacterium]|nr:hypothetical protein [Clostridia bacterium]